MKLLKQYVSITLGCALMALAFDWFYAPNELTLGGFTGIAQVINFFVPALPVGVTVIVLNAPLFLMSLKRFGKRFLVRSFFAVAVNSLFIDLINAVCTFQPMDKLLGCIYGGVLVGVSLGWLLREEATTGGTVSSGTTSANSGQVITVTPSYVVLKPGATRTLSAKATPASASQSFTYKSGNSSVATVSPSGVITAVGTGSTSITVSNGKATALVTVIVNRSASASSGSDSSNGDDASNGDDDKITLDPTVQTIQDSTDNEVVFAQSEVPVITGDILNSLRTTGKTLCVVGDGYTLQVSGKDVRNTTGELNTSLELQQVEQGLEFVVNDGKTVPCSARIDLDKSDYSRLYLYNETTGKWQYLNSYKDGVITLDTAGRYLLTNENLRFANINWSFFIAGGAVLVVIAVAYIAFKKRYWFW